MTNMPARPHVTNTSRNQPMNEQSSQASRQRACKQHCQRPPTVLRVQKRVGYISRQDGQRTYPEVERHLCPRSCQHKPFVRAFVSLPTVVQQAKRPRRNERQQQQRCYTTQDQPHLCQERHLTVRMNQRKERRNDDCRNRIAEQGECRQILNTATKFACDDRCGSSRWHNKTHHQALTDYGRILLIHTQLPA